MEIVIAFIAFTFFIIIPAIVVVLLVNLRRDSRELGDELRSLRRDMAAVETRLSQLERAGRDAVQLEVKPAQTPAAVTSKPMGLPPAPVAQIPTPIQVAEQKPTPVEQAVVRPPAQVTAFTQSASVVPPPYLSQSFVPREAQAPKTEEEQSAQERSFTLEETLGKNWLNKLGVGLLVIGIAFFLAYKLPSMSALGKILTGYGASAALLFGGLWLERKKSYRIFAAAGIGGGWALGYFTTFAMYHLNASRVIDSLVLDLVLMLIVAAGMVAHSLRYKSQTVTALAFLLAFATLLTSHLESQVVFSLAASAVLAVALVIITVRKHWVRLELAGLLAVYLTHFFWLSRVMPDHNVSHFTEFWPSTILILLYWLIFRVAYLIDKVEAPERHLAAVLNAAGVLGLLKYQSAHPEWAWWALAALGVIEFGLGWSMRKSRRTGFAILTTIGILLLVAAVPFKFHGFSWPVLWLVEAQVLAIAGLRLGEPLFRRLGLLAGFATGIVLAGWDVFPLIYFRLDQPDAGRHWQLTIALALAAVLYWIHAEIYPRRWPVLNESSALGVYLGLAEWEQYAAPVTSFLALGAAATALWVVLPDRWVTSAWMLLALALGVVADRLKSVVLSMEADAAALIAVMAIFAWNLPRGGTPEYSLPALIAVGLLYLCSFRKTGIEQGRQNLPAIYTWTAAVLVVSILTRTFYWRLGNANADVWLPLLWLGIALVFFEVGRGFKRRDLLWQGFSLGLLGGLAAFVINTNFSAQFIAREPLPLLLGRLHFFQTLCLLLPLFWIAERAKRAEAFSIVAKTIGYLHAVIALLLLALWPVFAVQNGNLNATLLEGLWLWISIFWGALALAVMVFSALTQRAVVNLAAIVLAIMGAVRVCTIDLAYEPPSGWRHGVLFRAGVVALLLLLALPFAYRIRRLLVESKSAFAMSSPIFTGPHQWLFFLAFVMEVIVLAAKLTSAHITIAWAALGVAGFLFALLVGERSFRLSGLALLLLSVLKILLMDVWQLNPSDRYVTLIILGLALIGVSFLYTRFSAQIRKLL